MESHLVTFAEIVSLANNSLTSALPTEIGLLKQLGTSHGMTLLCGPGSQHFFLATAVLSLARNRLSGSVPSELGELSLGLWP